MTYIGIWFLIGFSIQIGMYISGPISVRNRLNLAAKDLGFPLAAFLLVFLAALVWPYTIYAELEANS